VLDDNGAATGTRIQVEVQLGDAHHTAAAPLKLAQQ
jgi:hypothetical protein